MGHIFCRIAAEDGNYWREQGGLWGPSRNRSESLSDRNLSTEFDRSHKVSQDRNSFIVRRSGEMICLSRSL
jgi:hypothetical protein